MLSASRYRPIMRLLTLGLLLLAAPAAGAVPVLGFHLDGAVTTSTTTSDAYIAFMAGAAAGVDPFDAYALAPPATAYVQLFAVLGPETGPSNGVQLAINALPPGIGDTLDVQMGVLAVLNNAYVGAPFTLTWPQLQEIPAAWSLHLIDRVTGTDLDLRQQPSYTFQHTPGETAPRFTLRLVDNTVTGEEGGAVALSTLEVAPNPVRGPARVAYTLPEATEARLTVYDLLGRTVAVLHEGPLGAGRHEGMLGPLAPGVYVVRLEAGGRVLVRRMSVLG